MVNNPISKVIHLLILVYIFFLAGCNQATFSKPTINLSTSTGSPNIETLTVPTTISNTPVSPTVSSILVPTQTFSPNPSLTPLATLIPASLQDEVARLMETNDDCSGACFWGITPGITRFDQAFTFLKTLQDTELKVTKDGIQTYNHCFVYKEGTIVVCLIFPNDNGIVSSLTAKAGGLQAPNISGKDWLPFKPESVLKAYGVPKHVIIGMGSGPEGRIDYGMTLLYDQMYIRYDGNQIMILPQKIMHVCPLADNNIQQFDLTLGKYDQNIWKDGVDLTYMSSLTMDSFYKILVGDPQKACFDLDYQKFLSSISPIITGEPTQPILAITDAPKSIH